MLTCFLNRCCEYDILAVEAVEAVSSGNARYIGVRLEPKNDFVREGTGLQSDAL